MSRRRSLDCSNSEFGPMAPHYGAFRTLNLCDCTQVNGNMIQTLLESCHGLEEFVAPTIRASQVKQGQPWASLSLKSLELCITVDGTRSTAIGGCEQSRILFVQLER
ncbi:hypothetical protein BGZ82_009787 [Podila clonocystis]|nr:hypothetical protein BGZ82_009787 [Podila clonocystis]